MPRGSITDVFFDLDHTLWDFDRNSALAFARVFKQYNIDLEVAEFVRIYEPINLLYWKKFREETITREELRRSRLVDVFQVLKLEMSIDTIDLLANCYIKELPIDNYLFDGTLEILEYLSGKYKLHIITNGFGEVQYLKLKNSRIDKYFSTITTSEEAGVKKPNKIIFDFALSKARAFPYSSIMIGDNIEADMEGAKGAGMATLHFNRNGDLRGPFLTINELLQIKEHL